MSNEDFPNAADDPVVNSAPVKDEPDENAELHRNPINTAVALLICFAAWLIPGLGHIVLGRWGRALILAACILAMFALGIGMQGRLYDTAFEHPLHIFAFFANLGVGLPYFLAERMGAGTGVMTVPTYDYGTTYLWVCGLLNYLVVLDAFDISQGRKP